MVQAESFADLALRFRAYHSNSLNVVLHMVTTPMGLVAALIPLRQNCGLLPFAALVGAYAVSLAGADTRPLHICPSYTSSFSST